MSPIPPPKIGGPVGLALIGLLIIVLVILGIIPEGMLRLAYVSAGVALVAAMILWITDPRRRR